jgi:hypothetical protein
MTYIIKRTEFCFGASYMLRNSTTWTQNIKLAQQFDNWEDAKVAKIKMAYNAFPNDKLEIVLLTPKEKMEIGL